MTAADEPATGRRRRWFFAAGATALVAGAGSAWWRGRAEAEAAVERATTEALWSSRFALAGGGTELDLASLRGRPLLLNFWAPWCEPCVREMPALDRFSRTAAARGWQVVGIAIDQPEKVSAFLERRPVGFPIVVGGGAAVALAARFGNPAGSLPFTVVVSREGTPVAKRLGETTEAQMQDWERSYSG